MEVIENILKEYSVILTTSFLWHESEDIDKKKAYFQNFSWFQFFVYKFRMIMCTGTAPQTTLLNNSFVDKNLCKNFHKRKGFQTNSFGEICFIGENYKYMQ